MSDNTVRGRFVWHELVTPSNAGAHEFYSKAVGWTQQSWEHDPAYLMFVAPKGAIGASVETRDQVPQWVPYIGTPDVDATVAEAQRLGAKVKTPPTELPQAGKHAVLTDPHGADFGVHGSPSELPAEQPADYGEFSWHELATTTDPVAAFRFYAELFGWDDMQQMDMGPMGTYLIFGRNGMQLGGMFNKGDMGKPGSGYWVGYVRVRDLDGAVAKAKGAHGTLLTGPMDVPGGDRIAQLMDPHGAFFAVHTVAADVGAAPARLAAKRKKKAAARPGEKTAAKIGQKKGPKKAKKKATKKAAKKSTKKSAKKAAKKAVKKAVKKAAKKIAKKVAKKAAKKTGKKAAKKRTKRAAHKSAKKRAKKTAAKAAGKRSKPAKHRGRKKAARHR